MRAAEPRPPAPTWRARAGPCLWPRASATCDSRPALSGVRLARRLHCKQTRAPGRPDFGRICCGRRACARPTTSLPLVSGRSWQRAGRVGAARACGRPQAGHLFAPVGPRARFNASRRPDYRAALAAAAFRSPATPANGPRQASRPLPWLPAARLPATVFRCHLRMDVGRRRAA